MVENLPIVSSDDQVVGSAEKHEAHKYPVKRHRAISVWLVDENNHLLLQQRSASKIVGAGWWANTVCGNVWVDESYEACAVRRLKGELGLNISSDQLEKGRKFEYRAYCNETYGEHEVDQIFVLEMKREEAEKLLQPVDTEVARVLWVPLDELRIKVREYENEHGFYSAEASLAASWNELAENMSPMKLEIQKGTLLLAPWTVMMIIDDLISI